MGGEERVALALRWPGSTRCSGCKFVLSKDTQVEGLVGPLFIVMPNR